MSIDWTKRVRPAVVCRTPTEAEVRMLEGRQSCEVVGGPTRADLDKLSVSRLAAEYFRYFRDAGTLIKGIKDCVCVTCKNPAEYRLSVAHKADGLHLCRSCVTADLVGEARPRPPFV